MTLINYIYLPKSIQKVNRGVLFLYKGVALNEESALNEVVRYLNKDENLFTAVQMSKVFLLSYF